MKYLFLTVSAAVLMIPAVLSAGDPSFDNSRAGTDGPHVFYRGNQIVVKSVERRDTGMTARTVVYTNRSAVLLSCSVPEKGDQFRLLLQDSLKIQPDQYPLPAKMLVLSDIEGDFQGLKMMLQGAKIMNRDFAWTFGRGHLVLLGDYFDRGLNVTECLWLIYKLEKEAEKAGGKVHFILGNHEMLNLQGNTEYVRTKYLANAKLIGEDYNKWYDNNSELGRWLRTKNVVEKIGDYVFCHGGMSPDLVKTKMSMTDMNRIARQYIGVHQEQIPAGNPRAIYNTQTGLLWYREASKNMLTTEQMQSILDYYGGKRIVVGHTVVSDLTALYGGRLICIDLYHEDNVRRGFMKTLWIEDGYLYGLDSRGEKTSVFSISFPRKDQEHD